MIDEKEEKKAWRKKYREAAEEFSRIKDLPVLQCADGEIIEVHQVTQAMLNAEQAFKDLAELKRTFDELYMMAERWYDVKKKRARLEALKERQLYPSEKDRTAYSEIQAIKERKDMEGADLFRGFIHDERSRIYNYSRALENIGHAARQLKNIEMNLLGKKP